MPGKRYAVIMAGGRGERFWPLSTSKHPKQVLTVFSGKPMLAMAVDYLKGIVPPERIFIITSRSLAAVTRRAVPSVPSGNVIGEPFGRDTAAVCALGSALVSADDPDGLLCVLTADHMIGDLPVFRKTISECFRTAESGDVLITIGMKPASPNTAFGYIEAGNSDSTGSGKNFCRVKRFVEKPDMATAQKYLRTGRYYWNSGMFVWSAKSFMGALNSHAPELYSMACRLSAAAGRKDFARTLAKEYSAIKKISVDYAVMEKAGNILMARGLFKWTDVGSWSALSNLFKPDSSGNIILGNSEHIDASGNVVVSGKRLTALIGVKDMVVVQTPEATLICPRDRAQDVKKMVQKLSQTEKYRKLL